MREQEEVEMHSMLFLTPPEVTATLPLWRKWRQYLCDIQKTTDVDFAILRADAIIEDMENGE